MIDVTIVDILGQYFQDLSECGFAEEIFNEDPCS